jgi:hypothetical protein
MQRKLGIYNGVDAALSAFPQTVMIRVINTDLSEVRCAGALFAYNLVVTAGKLIFLCHYHVYHVNIFFPIFFINQNLANCFDGTVKTIWVYAGVVDVTDGTAQTTWPTSRHILQAKKYIKHASYDSSTKDNNIALVYLPVDLYYSQNVQILNMYLKDPATLAIRTSDFYEQKVKVAGWGQTSGTGSLSNTLKTTTLALSNSCSFTIADAGKSMCALTGADFADQVTI